MLTSSSTIAAEKRLANALALAEQYQLFDLDRLERMVLKQIAREYFVLTPSAESDE